MASQAKEKEQTGHVDALQARQQKLHVLQDIGVNPYPHTFGKENNAGDVQEKYKDLEDGTETEDKVAVAGRIMAMRNQGMFIDMQDPSGRIQIFCHKDNLTSEQLDKIKLLDIGDIIGVNGIIRRTPRGELSVRAKEVTLLTKSVRPLPEKYHGLTDVEQRYRQRYLDLIMNEDSRNTLRARSRVISLIRRYMEDMGAIEVETPMLHPIMGGATAAPFTTHHNALDTDFFLRVAPELYLKRLVVGGLSNDVFEIGRCFRNEGISPRHNPEFTSIEGYHTYKDYIDIMTLVEEMVQSVVRDLHGSLVVPFGEEEIDFTGPWERKTMCELVLEHTGIDLMPCETAQEALDAAAYKGYNVPDNLSWGKIVEFLFEEFVESKLIQPIHVTDFPVEVSPLAKNHRDNPRLVERFETYVNTWEIANAFTELNDPKVQYERFMGQVEAREAGDEEAQMLDQDYINALEFGLPPCGGWGMGIDRLVMVLTGSPNIRDVICFPTLRPKKDKKEATPKTISAENSAPANADYKTLDENAKRFVMVVNGKEDNMARVMNALGHSMAGLAGNVAKDEGLSFVDYADADGNIHPSISHYPVIVLKAKNSNQIRKIRAAAEDRGIAYTNFTDTMTTGSTEEQMNATKAQSEDELNYLGLCMFGDRDALGELTGKLSLYK